MPQASRRAESASGVDVSDTANCNDRDPMTSRLARSQRCLAAARDAASAAEETPDLHKYTPLSFGEHMMRIKTCSN